MQSVDTSRPPSLPLFSQTGRSVGHIWSTLSTGTKRGRKSLPPPLEKPDLEFETSQMKKLKEDKRNEELHKKPVLSQAFRAISRTKHEITVRNRTEPPNPGHYNPNWTVVRPRTNLGPKYSLKATEPREQVIYLPDCLETDCSHVYPRGGGSRTSSPDKAESPVEVSLNRSVFEDSMRKTQRTLKDFTEQATTYRSQWSPVPEGPRLKLKSALDFNIQTPRAEFVKEKDPPHEGRFAFMEPRSMVLSTNRNSVKYDFSKVVERPEVFKVAPSAPYYDVNKEVTKPKLSRFVLSFAQRPDRKPNLHFHSLGVPHSPDWSSLEKSLNMTMRTPNRMPKMKSKTPRDDLMYRTTETYLMNVPEKQLASDTPKYGGSPRHHDRSTR